jgi:hypothetical protein
MPISIQLGENFYCYAFAGLTPSGELNQVEVAPKVWASKGLPVVPGEHWERWMGELAFRGLHTSLVLTATALQPAAGVVFNDELKRKLEILFLGILLQGVPDCRESYLIAGANETGDADARQFGRARAFYTTAGLRPLRVGIAELNRAAELAIALSSINRAGEEWRRLRRGIDALFDGIGEPRWQDGRLHDFVRCLEALILPEPGRTKTQFIHRAQTFAIANDAAREALEQMYDVRSQVEHLNHPLDPLPGATVKAREELLYRRTRQADELARFALRNVLDHQQLIETFKREDTIDAFWKQPDHLRAASWGPRLDLSSIQ